RVAPRASGEAAHTALNELLQKTLNPAEHAAAVEGRTDVTADQARRALTRQAAARYALNNPDVAETVAREIAADPAKATPEAAAEELVKAAEAHAGRQGPVTVDPAVRARTVADATNTGITDPTLVRPRLEALLNPDSHADTMTKRAAQYATHNPEVARALAERLAANPTMTPEDQAKALVEEAERHRAGPSFVPIPGLPEGFRPIDPMRAGQFNRALDTGRARMGIMVDPVTKQPLSYYETTDAATGTLKRKFMVVEGQLYDITRECPPELIRHAVAERYAAPTAPTSRTHGLGMNTLGLVMSLPGLESHDPFTKYSSYALATSSGANAALTLGRFGTGASVAAVPMHVLMPILSGHAAIHAGERAWNADNWRDQVGYGSLAAGKTIQAGLFARQAGGMALRAAGFAPGYAIPVWGQVAFVVVEVVGGTIAGSLEADAQVLEANMRASAFPRQIDVSLRNDAEVYLEVLRGNTTSRREKVTLPNGQKAYNLVAAAIPDNKKDQVAAIIARASGRPVESVRASLVPGILIEGMAAQADANRIKAELAAVGVDTTVQEVTEITVTRAYGRDTGRADPGFDRVNGRPVPSIAMYTNLHQVFASPDMQQRVGATWQVRSDNPAEMRRQIMEIRSKIEAKHREIVTALVARGDCPDNVSVVVPDEGNPLTGTRSQTVSMKVNPEWVISFMRRKENRANFIAEIDNRQANTFRNIGQRTAGIFSSDDSRDATLRGYQEMRDIAHSLDMLNLDMMRTDAALLELDGRPIPLAAPERRVDRSSGTPREVIVGHLDAVYSNVIGFNNIPTIRTTPGKKFDVFTEVGVNTDGSKRYEITEEAREWLRAHAHLGTTPAARLAVLLNADRNIASYVMHNPRQFPPSYSEAIRISSFTRIPVYRKITDPENENPALRERWELSETRTTRTPVRPYAEYYAPIDADVRTLQASVTEMNQNRPALMQLLTAAQQTQLAADLLNPQVSGNYQSMLAAVTRYEQDMSKVVNNASEHYKYLAFKHDVLKIEMDLALAAKNQETGMGQGPLVGYFPAVHQSTGLQSLPQSYAAGGVFARLPDTNDGQGHRFDSNLIQRNFRELHGADMEYSEAYRTKVRAFNRKLLIASYQGGGMGQFIDTSKQPAVQYLTDDQHHPMDERTPIFVLNAGKYTIADQAKTRKLEDVFTRNPHLHLYVVANPQMFEPAVVEAANKIEINAERVSGYTGVLPLARQTEMLPEYYEIRRMEAEERGALNIRLMSSNERLVRENTALKLRVGYNLDGPITNYI
ncbi:MAG: hypothetical protein K2Q01_11940, partial [Rickettsiales bacterium]|nr:hypothetical protein [Rickettsiales bacterium]